MAAGNQGEIDAGEDGSDISRNQRKLSVTFNIPENATTRRRVFSATGTLSVVTTHDNDAEDEVFNWENFTFTPNGGLTLDNPAEGTDASPLALAIAGPGLPPTTFTIKDDETQTYTVTLDAGQKPVENGDDIEVTVAAVPPHADGSEALTLISSDPLTYIPTEDAFVLGSADAAPVGVGNTLPITIPAPSDKNRVADTFTLSLHSGVAGRSTPEDSVDIKVADANELPAVAAMVVDKEGEALDPQPTSVKEGESIYVTVMAVDEDGDPAPFAEELTVELMATGTADSDDYTFPMRSIKIAANADASEPVELEVDENDDVGRESLMFDATVSGEAANGTETSTSAGVLSLYIEDETDKKIEPKTTEADYDGIKAAIAAGAAENGEEGLNPGEKVTLMASDLFDVMTGYSAGYEGEWTGDAVSVSTTGETITITAEMAGDSEVTIFGTARMDSSSLVPSQAVSNVASVKFPVTVVDTPLVVTVTADPMEIEEGGTSMITATANRYVTAGDGDVEIDLTVVGDGELAADSIMIAMGDMSGYTMLTAMADDDMENSTLTVVATGSGIMGLMQVMITVMDGVAPVPALPLFGQLLLALFMMVGGARLYRRRQG